MKNGQKIHPAGQSLTNRVIIGSHPLGVAMVVCRASTTTLILEDAFLSLSFSPHRPALAHASPGGGNQ